MAEDESVTRRIKRLTEQEHALYERAGKGQALSDAERQHLGTIETELDQCYDLLRQRRARRDAGLDPNAAQVRDVGTVEGYLG
jgi:uncharacterized protein DUF2630